MDIDILKANWAAWLALPPIILVVVLVVRAVYYRSARGQLVRALKAQRQSHKALVKARSKTETTAARLEKLSTRSDEVIPRILEETMNAVEDCRTLEKILDDKFQVTTQQLRRVIFEEFPPSRHEKLRDRYLPQDVEDGRPFSFEQ